ncbi:MAG: hypothetical protein II479_08155 [Bacteroidales bacterium]|jgi:hypothetical protein|nr:hypothetical protein [Bacteroidales bacterium]
MTEIESKHGIVSRQPYEVYMSFTDLSNFVRFLPADKREGIQADYDTLTASLQGMSFGLKVHERVPYSRVELVDYGAPFAFHIALHCDPVPDNPYKTDFSIKLEADLNFMLKMALGGKLREALDRLVDGLVDASNGQMPEGFDPSQYDMHV